jgi:hypothetical protein
MHTSHGDQSFLLLIEGCDYVISRAKTVKFWMAAVAKCLHILYEIFLAKMRNFEIPSDHFQVAAFCLSYLVMCVGTGQLVA